MKKTCAVLALAALALAGCSGGGQASAAPSETAKTTISPTPTPSPTPTIMTTVEAGKKYLSIVCPGNALSYKAAAVVQAEPFNLKTSKAATAALRDGFRKEIETLTDEKVLWPANVKADIAALADSMYGDVTGTESAANQSTQSDFITVWNDWTSLPARSTAQKIRVKLGLPSDTKVSCNIK